MFFEQFEKFLWLHVRIRDAIQYQVRAVAAFASATAAAQVNVSGFPMALQILLNNFEMAFISSGKTRAAHANLYLIFHNTFFLRVYERTLAERLAQNFRLLIE